MLGRSLQRDHFSQTSFEHFALFLALPNELFLLRGQGLGSRICIISHFLWRGRLLIVHSSDVPLSLLGVSVYFGAENGSIDYLW